MKFRKNFAEIVANRLIMDGVIIHTPQCAARLAEVWPQVYPDVPMPSVGMFIDSLWPSTRAVMEKSFIRQADYFKQQAFVCERFIHFHMTRLYPVVKMEELRRAVADDMDKMGLGKFDDGKAMLAYTSRKDPEYADTAKLQFSSKETALIIEMYQWLVCQYEKKASELPKAAAVTVREKQELTQDKPRCEAAAFKTSQAADPVNGGSDRAEGRQRRSSQSRRKTPEELEERTLARIKGQLAIDLILMNGEADSFDESDDDIEATEQLQFIAACQACSELPDEYKDEQRLSKMWEVISPQDKMLFSAGSMSELLDFRFTVLTCRCLLYAISRADQANAADIPSILAEAFELWEAFELDSRPDSIRRLLKRNIERYYAVNGKIPESALSLLRSKADDIRDAYDMYLEQINEEQKQRENEMNAKLADQRKFDQIQQQIAQRANVIALIKKFTALENGAALGWLCMAVNGADYSKEKLRYYIENLMQRLETVGLVPIAVDKVGYTFDGGSEGADMFVDMHGRPLEAGVKYQMAQLGWKFGDDVVVYPMAERV